MSEPAALLSISGLSKRFGGIQALKDAAFDVRAGEIHALLGANGAGKSTLIKILSGLYPADGGSILVDGVELDGASRRRIAFVHQDLGLIDKFTVAENMALDYGFPLRGGLIDWGSARARAQASLAQLGADIPADVNVERLSRADKSIVAIARALAGKADIVVLDEPTASLPEADVSRLFDTLLRLKAMGAGVVLVTHRLDEVFRIADAVTVLRDGRTVVVSRPLTLTPDELVKAIVGYAPAPVRRGPGPAERVTALEARDVHVGRVGPVSLKVRAGEIVGLAGLRGAGHEEIGRALAGVLPIEAGEIRVGDAAVRLSSPARAIAHGVAFSTGRRAEEALASTMSVKENLFLNPVNFGQARFMPRSRTKERADALTILQRFGVRPLDPDRGIMILSGGNQQKVVLGRCAGQNYRLLVLEEPTIGVDYGAKAEIYRMLASDVDAGGAAIVVSSDLDELTQVADRVLCFSRGRIVAEIDREAMSVEALTRAVTGLETAA